MVSDEPLDDRCGHVVQDKVGIHIEASDLDEPIEDDEIEAVLVDHDDEDVHHEKEPDYISVVKHLRYGFSVVGIDLDDSAGDERGYVEIEDDDPYVTNRGTEHQGYCERYPLDAADQKFCYVHRKNGGSTEGNTKAMTHGLKAQRSNYYNQLDEEEQALVQKLAGSWIDNAPFDRDHFAKVTEVYRIAVDQYRLWNAQDEFDAGIVYDQYEDVDVENNRIETTQENPANLPYDRLDRTLYKKLREIGVMDSPETEQAEAMESLASKFSQVGSDE